MGGELRTYAFLGTLTVLGSLQACRAIVDSPEYVCVQNDYLERFDLDDPSAAEGFSRLEERCWKRSGVLDSDDLQPDDGDLVIRVSEGQRWADGREGPFAYQRVKKDFVLATRVEILNQITSSHCLGAEDGAGLAVRDDAGSWATLLLRVAQPPYPPHDPPFDCASENEDAVPLTHAFIETNDTGWGESFDTTALADQIGLDGEASIAACRVNEKLSFFYRDGAGDWQLINGPYRVGEGELDVGLAVSGDPERFAAEGHFAWAWYFVELGADGCSAALDRLKPLEEW